MYPSGVCVNTAAFTDNDFNTSLGFQQDLYSSSSSLFHSSSPFNYIYEDEMIYSQHLQAVLCETNQGTVVTNNINSVTGNTENSTQIDVNMKEYMCGGSTNQTVAKKKACKKDRHSKIITAHGPRDRRIRLSLDVARKLFGLQDILGFHKASKTVEWLFEHSKNAIKELTERLPHMDKDSSLGTTSVTSTLDCDVVPGIDESIPRTTSSKTVVPSTCSKKKRIKSIRKAALLPRTKETREKVRESVRERTKEKRQQQLNGQQSASLMNWRSFGTGRKEAVATSHNTGNYNDRLSVEVEKMQNARKQQPQSRGSREEIISISEPNNHFETGSCIKMQNALKQQPQSQGSREEIISISEPNNHFETGSCSPYALFKYYQQTNFWNSS